MNHATNQQTNHSGTAGQADPTNGNSTSISSAQLIDARALWWREAEPCDHTESDPDWDECDCVTYPHWAFGNGWMGFTAPLIDPTNGGQTQYLTDRHLLIPQDRLSNWPGIDDPSAPYLGDLSVVDRTVQHLTALLTAPETAHPVSRRFDLALLDPLRAAGCELRALVHDSGVHAVVDATGNRIGLLMPLNDTADGTDSTADSAAESAAGTGAQAEGGL